jgi:phospholipase/carboxylesterase
MRRSHLLWLLPVLLVVGLLFSVRSVPALEKPRLAYIERLAGHASESASLPLVVAVHGLGDTPEDFAELYRDFDVPARIIAPRAPDAWGQGTSWYPFRGTPEARRRAIRSRADDLARLISYVSAERATRGKAVITGFSQGGVMSFAMAAYHPELLRAALPIAGSFDPAMPELVPSASSLPLFAFHGRRDDMIAYPEAEAAVARFQKAGRKATLTGYDDVGHHIPPAMQRDYFAALRSVLQRP